MSHTVNLLFHNVYLYVTAYYEVPVSINLLIFIDRVILFHFLPVSLLITKSL